MGDSTLLPERSSKGQLDRAIRRTCPASDAVEGGRKGTAKYVRSGGEFTGQVPMMESRTCSATEPLHAKSHCVFCI
jgi:hypothetical protein